MKKVFRVAMALVLVAALAACSLSGTGLSVQTQSTTSSAQTSVATPTHTASVSESLAENSATHESTEDYTWDPAAEVLITLSGAAIAVEGVGVEVNGAQATITSAGTYRLQGSLTDGQIIVNAGEAALVRLILDGVDLHSSTSAPVYIASADETILVLADGTQNLISDSASYVFASPEEDEPNAAVFSKSNLTVTGNGALTVNGNYNEGVASKDGLVIAGGTLTINAVDDGLRGKDYVVVHAGTLTINAQGDGLKSDNEEDASLGYIAIDDGTFTVTSGGDAITAQTDVLITGGEFTLVSGGGSHNRVSDTVSAKGLKAVVNVTVEGGTFTIDAADDAIHSNQNVTINGGALVLVTGDDGVHADAAIEINGGDLNVTQSYEGIESALITINAGNLRLTASDDGINVANGVDGSGMMPGMGPGGPGGGGTFATYTGSNFLYINGGSIVVDAAGDGVDVNGAIQMTGGVLVVNGPTEQMNGALDYDGGFNLTGGFIVAAGSSGMAQAPDAGSSQPSVLIYLTSPQPAGTVVHIQNSAGEDILTFAPSKEFQSIAFTSAKLVNGATYQIYGGGNSTGDVSDGLYQGGSYTPGTQVASFTVSGAVTTVGTGGQTRPGPGRP